jgi:hypothetical protein
VALLSLLTWRPPPWRKLMFLGHAPFFSRTQSNIVYNPTPRCSPRSSFQDPHVIRYILGPKPFHPFATSAASSVELPKQSIITAVSHSRHWAFDQVHWDVFLAWICTEPLLEIASYEGGAPSFEMGFLRSLIDWRIELNILSFDCKYPGVIEDVLETGSSFGKNFCFGKERLKEVEILKMYEGHFGLV